MKKEYPSIAKQSIKAGAEVFFADKSGVRSDYHRGTTWAAKGKTPVVESTGQRVRLNMLSAISRQGAIKFMVTTQRVTGEVGCEFLDLLIYRSRRPVFTDCRRSPMHRSKRVRAFADEARKNRLRLFFLSSLLARTESG